MYRWLRGAAEAVAIHLVQNGVLQKITRHCTNAADAHLGWASRVGTQNCRVGTEPASARKGQK